MNEESILAWNIIEKTSANLFLTGKAGTGKTTFLKQLKEKSPKRMVVLAPTGIAAINAGGVTIHSFFQLPLSPYLPGTSFGGNEKKKYQFSALKRKIIRSIDLLVIDGAICSMPSIPCSGDTASMICPSEACSCS